MKANTMGSGHSIFVSTLRFAAGDVSNSSAFIGVYLRLILFLTSKDG